MRGCEDINGTDFVSRVCEMVKGVSNGSKYGQMITFSIYSNIHILYIYTCTYTCI